MTHGTGQALAAAVVRSAEREARWWSGQPGEITATTADTGPDPVTG